MKTLSPPSQPAPGDIVHLRSRHYVIEAAEKGPHGTRIEAACLNDDNQRLRDLHAAMDRAVLDAYGWTDLPTDCQFLLDYEKDEDDEPTPNATPKKSASGLRRG